ncbi:LPS assembly lipoprotein LptE [[Pasteurella] aerogenes]|uniref:LPS-assembly lipoprotein LptE n=1 Tax=[Pasteurella] mairii TaxID=757 RepID=A0A379B729_9PAST|nr:LPS assembly lipoprotein LptE [[Pasteurella] mairii]SUB34079.1 putative lipopolysccharide assembly LptE protein [[Pasteurella] mairii]
MLKSIKTFFIVAGVFALSACGFHFQNGELIPNELKTLTLESSDPYSEMSMAVRQQLLLNGINLVEAKSQVPTLRLNKTTTNDEVASIFKRGREAEKLLILDVDATVKLNQVSYPLSTRVSRTFFDNSRAALAKSAEKEVLWNDMREQAALQLIRKMIALQQQVKTQK